MPQEASGGSGAAAARRYKSTALSGAYRGACTKLVVTTGRDNQQSTAEPVSGEQTGSNTSRSSSQAISVSVRAQHFATLAAEHAGDCESRPGSGTASSAGEYRDARSEAAAECCH